MSSKHLNSVLTALGYAEAKGYLRAEDLRFVSRNRYELGQAFRNFNVDGVFGLRRSTIDSSESFNFVPLVYVAQVESSEEAREVHRSAWSQGIVPFVLVITNNRVWCCNGFAFGGSDWQKATPSIELSELSKHSELPRELAHLTARALRTSIVWSDKEVPSEGRVDTRLLKNLRGLTKALLSDNSGIPKLPSDIANPLIGKFLYLRFLRDRQILLPALKSVVDSFDKKNTDLEIESSIWSALSEIESIFNGSIFPIPKKARALIKPSHLAMLKHTLLDDGEFTDGGIQQSFKEFRFSSIRTETLSAVYEHFLQTTENSGGKQDGAFYTPPFLVDFVLTKIEQDGVQIDEKHRVFDCAAGSGIFLVGAFRRIIESQLKGASNETIPLSDLHKLILENIWGIEKNKDACHVTAFSLYLTILDYVDKAEIDSVIAARGETKIFPSLVGGNILTRDFFDPSPLPATMPKKFDLILANPPWENAKKLGRYVGRYQKGPRKKDIDRARAASMFFWKSIDAHLSQKGRFGFVMSGRVFISSGARNFTKALVSEVGLTDITNLSHMRNKLFVHAKHPAVIITGYNDKKLAPESIRIYSPTTSSQPIAQDGNLWSIIEDRSETELFRKSRLSTTSELIQALMLRPIDRQLARRLVDQSRSGECATLRMLLIRHNLDIKGGGDQPETGVPKEYTLSANNKTDSYYLKKLGIESDDLFPDISYKLPTSLVQEQYRQLFGGNILIAPRSAKHFDFIEMPVAFNSSFNGVYSRDGNTHTVGLLKAMAVYLNSNFARYCFSLFGRDWALDERRLEKKELLDLPFPNDFLDIKKAERFADNLSIRGNEVIYKSFDLSESFCLAAEEFSNFRIFFQNGKTPKDVHREPLDEEISKYENVLQREMNIYLGGKEKGVKAIASSCSERALAVVTVRYEQSKLKEISTEAILKEYDSSESNIYQDSTWLSFGANNDILLIKPLMRCHWTVERAYADADHIAQRLVSFR